MTFLQACGASTAPASVSEPLAADAGAGAPSSLSQPAGESGATIPSSSAMTFSEVQRAVVQVRAGGREGSGFIFDTRGWVLTSAAVVGDDEDVTVVVEGAALPGRVIGIVTDPGLAVIWFPISEEPQSLELAGPDETFDGKVVFLVGYSLPVRRAVVGEVSSPGDEGMRSLRIDTPVSPKAVGGPIIDINGAVIGVITGAVSAPISAGARVVHSERIRALLPSLMAGGEAAPSLTSIAPATSLTARYSGALNDARLSVVNAMTLEYTLKGHKLVGIVRISGEHDLWGGPVGGELRDGLVQFRLEFPNSGTRPSIAFDGRVLEDGSIEGSYRADFQPGTSGGPRERGTWSLAPAAARP